MKTQIDLDKNENIPGIEILNAGKGVAKDFLSDIHVRNLVS